MTATNPIAERQAGSFRLKLLGGFELQGRDGTPLMLPTRKAELLLAFLASPACQTHARTKLAGLLWSDRGEEQARGSLRNALAAIRQAVGASALSGDRDMIELQAGWLRVDVDELEPRADSEDIPAYELRKMIRSEFLEGVAAPSPEFDEWLAFERARCLRLRFGAGRAWIALREAAGDLGGAIEMAEALLSLDPLREKTHRLLIRLLTAAGEISRARAQFESCREILSRELGVEPSKETLALIRARPDSGKARVGPEAATGAGALAAVTTAPLTFSLVVLPFGLIGGDPDQAHVADGLAEDLITELSKLKDFSVIARQSSALFSGRPENAAAAAAELGVRYALSGSLRRAGDRLRVNAQLIDALGNRSVWAERYDRNLGDIFDIQDEIVASIISNVDAEVRHDERERAMRKLPGELDAWEMFHRGLSLIYRFTRESNAEGDAWFARAIERAPDFALPHAGLAYSALVKILWYFTPDPRQTVVAGLGHARQAVMLDASNAFAQVALGRLQVFAGEIEGAVALLRKAVDLNPSFAQARYGLAQALIYGGAPGEAIGELDMAMRLSPKDPLSGLFLTLKSFCHFSLGDYSAAESTAREATLRQHKDTWSRLALAAALVELGRSDEARQVIVEARRIEPEMSLARFADLVRHGSEKTRMKLLENLAAAGA